MSSNSGQRAKTAGSKSLTAPRRRADRGSDCQIKLFKILLFSPFVKDISTCSYAHFVLTENSGITITTVPGIAPGSHSSRSPRPVAYARPPCKKKEQSAPISGAISSSKLGSALRFQSFARPRRATAALLDPPPKPPPTGVRLTRCTAPSKGCSVISASFRAASAMRLSSPHPRFSSVQVNRQ